MNILANYIIYNYNDQSSLFYQNAFGKFFNTAFGSIDFLSRELSYMFIKLFGAVLGVNLLVISYLIINILCSYLLFRKLRIEKIIAVIFSLLYSFSIYFIFRVISLTPSLYPVFIFPLTFYLLLKGTRPIFLGMLSFLFLCLSSYYAFFSIIVVGLWYLMAKKPLNILKFISPLVIGIAMIFLPYLRQNTYLGNYSSESSMTVYRPLEDWYNLSFRPWYFLVPPKSSLFFGGVSKNIYWKIASTNYYLADDYTEEETAGSYMGWHFLLGMGVVAVLLLLKKFKKKEFPAFKSIYENKEIVVRSFILIFCILLISGPPSFTFSGITFYTPSYLLYYVIPVFRTLVRWAVVIYLFVLIINAYLVQDLYSLMKKAWQKTLFVIGFLSLNFVIFAIKIPIINVNKPPQEIEFLKKEFPESASYAVYPKGDYYSIFWTISHEDVLINPVDFVDYKIGFDANEFSKNLVTPDGIKEFLSSNPKYLVYYKDKISNDDLEKISKLNPYIKSIDDISNFFFYYFGPPIFAQNNIFVYKVTAK